MPVRLGLRLAAVAAILFALRPSPAAALEHHLVRWQRTGRCEIVTTLPVFAGRFTEIGVYDNRQEAQRALKLNQKAKLCPPEDRTPPPQAAEDPDDPQNPPMR